MRFPSPTQLPCPSSPSSPFPEHHYPHPLHSTLPKAAEMAMLFGGSHLMHLRRNTSWTPFAVTLAVDRMTSNICMNTRMTIKYAKDHTVERVGLPVKYARPQYLYGVVVIEASAGEAEGRHFPFQLGQRLRFPHSRIVCSPPPPLLATSLSIFFNLSITYFS